MTVLRPVEPAAPQVRGDPPPHRAGRSLMALLAAILALPPLLMAGAAWHGWQQAWRDAEQEMLHGAEGAAEYLRRVLDGHDLRIQRANDLIAGLSDAEIRADEARLHRAFIRIAGQEADGGGPLTLFAFDRAPGCWSAPPFSRCRATSTSPTGTSTRRCATRRYRSRM